MIYSLHNWSLFQQPICPSQWAVTFHLVNCVFTCLHVCFSRGSQSSHSPVPGGEPERGGESWLDASDHHQPAGLVRTGWLRNTALVCRIMFFLCSVLCKDCPHRRECGLNQGIQDAFCISLTYLHHPSLILQQKIASSFVRTKKR